MNILWRRNSKLLIFSVKQFAVPMSHIKNDHTFVQQFQGRDETEAEINARGIRSYRITVSVHSQNAPKKVDNI